MRFNTRTFASLLVAAASAISGCTSDSKTSTSSKKTSAATAAAKVDTAAADDKAAKTPKGPGAQKGEGFSGHHRAGDDKVWVPAEFKKGMARFKDPGVYLDGVPVGMLKFGEMPVPLKPVWYKERAAVEFHPGDKGPRYKMVKQRRYRLYDYLKGIGIDVGKIREVHLYGGNKRRAAVIIKGKDLRKHRDFAFRFGSDIYGKPIPACPAGIGDGKCPDSVGAIAVYIKKKPPTREGPNFYLDGKKLKGIPYYGEPMRGGVRVYLDNSLATTIKRRKLKDSDDLKVTDPDGTVHWKFFGFLETHNVPTDKIVEGWIIYRNRRRQMLTRQQLENATFVAKSQRKGGVLFGNDKLPMNAIALHTKHVSKKQLPVIQPHELDD